MKTLNCSEKEANDSIKIHVEDKVMILYTANYQRYGNTYDYSTPLR